MLSLEKCREILRGESLSDSEITTVRDQLYGLADVAIDQSSKLALRKETTRERLHGWDVEMKERAAIREYLGGLSRPQAELATIIDFETRKERT